MHDGSAFGPDGWLNDPYGRPQEPTRCKPHNREHCSACYPLDNLDSNDAVHFGDFSSPEPVVKPKVWDRLD
jgi:hypothetical protein